MTDDLNKLNALKDSILKAKDKQKIEVKEPKKDDYRPGDAMRVCIELLAGMIAGVFIGFYLDDWFNTKPLFIIICFLFGSAAGALNVYKMAMRQSDVEE